ncbi:MAG: hypothetical protein VB092_00455 [Oscillospiraceae bacterium]|nr:hypothetical protein [Oscillospiraceae bacterium]
MKRFDETFAPLLGNEGLKTRLAAEFEQNAIPHACLITGDDGCGRNLAATLLAAAYLQDAHDLVRRGEHPDCIELRGEGAAGQIPVDRVRETLYELSKAAVTADGRRAAILRDTASLNRNSANALLKGLEAPPQGVIFILTAQSERDVLETIRSRCVRYGVLPLSADACRAAARTLYPTFDAQRLDTLCRLYGGRLGLLKRALSSPDRLALCDVARRVYAAAKKNDRLEMLAALDAVGDRVSLQAVMFDVTMCARADVLEDPSVAAFADRLTGDAAQCAADADRNINIKLLCTRFAAQRNGER